MTDAPSTGDAAASGVPRAAASGGRPSGRGGRPVLSFVAMVVLLAATLVGLRATGAANPLLETQVGGSAGGAPGRDAAYLEITNQGLVPVRIEAVSWDGRDLVDVEVFLPDRGAATDRFGRERFVDGPEAGATPFRPFDLRPSETRVVIVSGTSNCAAGPPFDGVHLEAQTWSGLRRTVRAAPNVLTNSSSIFC